MFSFLILYFLPC